MLHNEHPHFRARVHYYLSVQQPPHTIFIQVDPIILTVKAEATLGSGESNRQH